MDSADTPRGRRSGPLAQKVLEVEADTIRHTLELTAGNVSQAARLLGIGRNTLYVKMRRFGFSPARESRWSRSPLR